MDSQLKNIFILSITEWPQSSWLHRSWLQLLRRLKSLKLLQGSFDPLQVLLIAGLVFGATMLDGFLEMKAGFFQITCFLKDHAQIAMCVAIFRSKQ